MTSRCRLFKTADANGIDPYTNLKMLCTHLPAAGAVEDVEAPLPVRTFSAGRATADDAFVALLIVPGYGWR